MKETDLGKLVDELEKAANLNGEASAAAYRDVEKDMSSLNLTVADQQALIKALGPEILAEVTFYNLNLEEKSNLPLGIVTKEQLLDMSIDPKETQLSRLAAAAAATQLDDDEFLSEDRLEDIKMSYIATELLDMFKTEDQWKKIAKDDGNLSKSELNAALGKTTWDDHERKVLQHLADNYWEFQHFQSVSIDDVEAEVDEDIAFRFGEGSSNAVSGSDNDKSDSDSGESYSDSDESSNDGSESKTENTNELVDVLENKGASLEEKLAAVEKLAKKGEQTITLEVDGKKITCRVEFAPVAGSDRNYVHLFATDESGGEKVILRAIENEGKYEQQRDKNGNHVGYVGTWWANNHPDSAIAA